MAINGSNSRRQHCQDGKTCPWCFPSPTPFTDIRKGESLEDQLKQELGEDDSSEMHYSWERYESDRQWLGVPFEMEQVAEDGTFWFRSRE